MGEIDDFFSKNFTYGVVGASANENKYGFKIFKILSDSGFSVIGVNKKGEEVLGKRTFKSILDVEERIDVVDFVVPPKVTLQILEEVKEKGIRKVWFQPGSYDSKCILFCKKNKIKFLKDFCLYEQALKNFKS